MRKRFFDFKRLSGFITAVFFLLCFTIFYGSTVLAADGELSRVVLYPTSGSMNNQIVLSKDTPYFINYESEARAYSSSYNAYWDDAHKTLYLNGINDKSIQFGSENTGNAPLKIVLNGINNLKSISGRGGNSIEITSTTGGSLNFVRNLNNINATAIESDFYNYQDNSYISIGGNAEINIKFDKYEYDSSGGVKRIYGLDGDQVYIKDHAKVDIKINGFVSNQNYGIYAKNLVSITTDQEISIQLYNRLRDTSIDTAYAIGMNSGLNPQLIIQNTPKVFLRSFGSFRHKYKTVYGYSIDDSGIEGYKITHTGIDQPSVYSELTTTIEQWNENITDVSVNVTKPVHGKKALLSSITVDKDAPYYIASEQPCYWLKASYGHEGSGDSFTGNSFEKDEYYDSVIYLRAKSGYTFDYEGYQTTINPKVNGITRSSVAGGNGSTVFTARTWPNNGVTYYVIHRTYRCEGLPLSGSTIGVKIASGSVSGDNPVKNIGLDVKYGDENKYKVNKFWFEDASGKTVDTEGFFEADKKYTCKVILEPINGYIFDGYGNNYEGETQFNYTSDGVSSKRLNGSYSAYGLTNVEGWLLLSRDLLTGSENIDSVDLIMEKGAVGRPTSGNRASSSDVRLRDNEEIEITYANCSEKRMDLSEVMQEVIDSGYDEDVMNDIYYRYGIREVGDTFEEGLYYYPIVKLQPNSGFKFKVDSEGNADVDIMVNGVPDTYNYYISSGENSIIQYLEPYIPIPVPKIKTSSLPDAMMCVDYNEDPDGFKLETDAEVKIWSITAGSLPSGLELTSDGYIKGKADEDTTGTYTFSVKVENDAGSSVKEMTLKVLPVIEITDITININKLPKAGQTADKTLTFDVTPAEAKPYLVPGFGMTWRAFDSDGSYTDVADGDLIKPGTYYMGVSLYVDPDYQYAVKFTSPCSLSVPDLSYQESVYCESYYCAYGNYYSITGDHIASYVIFRPNRCESDGNQSYYKCLDCGKCFADTKCEEEASEESFIIKAHGHSWDYTAVDAEKHSMVCFYDSTHTEEEPHKWDDGFVTKYPTCTEKGEREYSCQKCYYKRKEDIPATGHEMGDWTSVDDEKHTRKCIHPGCTESETEAHDYEVISTTPATEDSTGEIKYQCKVCGHEYVEEIPKLDHTHDMTKTERVEAKCETAGNIEYYTCSKCHKTFSDEGGVFEVSEDDIVIPATGHDYEVIYEEEATVTTDGKKVSKCNNCGDEVTEIIPKLPAPPTPTPTPTPTSDPGLTATPTPAQTTPTPETQPTEDPGTQPTPSAGPEESKPETPFSAGGTEDELDKAIAALPDDNDPAGTEFAGLQAKVTKVTKKSIKLSWKKISGADGYIIYANKCGKKNKYEKLTTVKKNSITIKKVAGKKLKKGTYYKFLIVSVDSGKKVLSTSKTIHVSTTGGKNCNDKKVTTKAKGGKVALKVGKTFKLKARAVPEKKNKKVARHRKLAYESTDESIATVSAKGVITAKKKGTCYVYAYAQNGIAAKIKVTVR